MAVRVGEPENDVCFVRTQNSRRVEMKVNLLMVAMAALVFAASGTAQADGDATAGKVKAKSCAGCHGANGEGKKKNPPITGMPESEFIQAMQDYKSIGQTGTQGDGPRRKETERRGFRQHGGVLRLAEVGVGDHDRPRQEPLHAGAIASGVEGFFFGRFKETRLRAASCEIRNDLHQCNRPGVRANCGCSGGPRRSSGRAVSLWSEPAGKTEHALHATD
jgi:hypothetical protein